MAFGLSWLNCVDSLLVCSLFLFLILIFFLLWFVVRRFIFFFFQFWLSLIIEEETERSAKIEPQNHSLMEMSALAGK